MHSVIASGDPHRIAALLGIAPPSRPARTAISPYAARQALDQACADYLLTGAGLPAIKRAVRACQHAYAASSPVPYVPAPSPVHRPVTRAPHGALESAPVIGIDPARATATIHGAVDDATRQRIRDERERRDRSLAQARNGTTRALVHHVSRLTINQLRADGDNRKRGVRFTDRKPAPVNTDCYHRQVTLPAAPTPEKLQRLAADYAAWCKRQERNAKRRAARKAANA